MALELGISLFGVDKHWKW